MIPLLIHDREGLDESFHQALTRALHPADEAARRQWVAEHAEEIQTGIELHLEHILKTLATPFARREVAKPVLEFKDGSCITRLWVLDAGQHAILADRRDFFFHAGATASLVYEQIGPDIGHRVTEMKIDNADTWAWIQDLMQRGIAAQEREGDAR